MVTCWRKLQRGLTLLEMMIVLAIIALVIALVMGVLIGPKLIGLFHHSQRDIARMAVTKLADQDYPMWALQHPSTPCPTTLAELEHKARRSVGRRLQGLLRAGHRRAVRRCLVRQRHARGDSRRHRVVVVRVNLFSL